jgi:cysteine desulfurase/selenocysteine lyase
VIDAIVHYYTHDNSNIHRGVYELSQRATDGYEAARGKIANFLGAKDPAECILVRGATEGINLVANTWGVSNISQGDEILLTGLEHHSNIVPWQLLCERVGAKLQILESSESGELDLDAMKRLLSPRTKLVAVQQVSNALGTIHDVQRIVSLAKDVGAKVLVDGAQWVAHGPTDVAQLGCDFYTFSGHKLYGPTGIGVLWGKRELLEAMPPFQAGGDMIDIVSFDGTTFAPLPNKFEAGTPNIAGAIGLGAAIDYVMEIGFEAIAAIEDQLLKEASRKLANIEGLRIIGTASNKAAVISFVVDSPSIAPLDIATALSSEGIAVRTGHHCCMPLMQQFDIPGTCRVSMAIYNTVSEIDRLVEVLQQLIEARRRKHSEAASKNVETSLDIEFAKPTAKTIEAAADALSEEFLLFDDRESKTELLMEMGQALPDYFSQLKAISTAVPGCMSEVYLIGRPHQEQRQVFEFAADSNAEIVRGLISVLEQLFSGQTAESIMAFDTEAFFRKIGLDQFVSSQRRSGLEGMIRRIRKLAEAIVDRQTE